MGEQKLFCLQLGWTKYENSTVLVLMLGWPPKPGPSDLLGLFFAIPTPKSESIQHGNLFLSHLIIRRHQQCMEGMDGSCNYIIHWVIQGEAQQEEESSIKQQAQNTTFQGGDKLPCLGLKDMPSTFSVSRIIRHVRYMETHLKLLLILEVQEAEAIRAGCRA